LSHDPASRPTAADLFAQFKGAAQASSAVPVLQTVVREAPGRAAPAQDLPRQRALAPIIAAGLILLLIAVWAGLRLSKSPPDSQQSAESTVPPTSQHAGAPAAASHSPEKPLPAPPQVAPSASAQPGAHKPAPARRVSPSDQPAQPPAVTSAAGVHEQMPVVPRSALATIHGHVRVAVLVIVDPSGNVADAILENPGPSSYFARLAKEAARKWQFPPADTQDSRQWLVRFEFTRRGPTGHATPRS
jgi:TonB family protein